MGTIILSDLYTDIIPQGEGTPRIGSRCFEYSLSSNLVSRDFLTPAVRITYLVNNNDDERNLFLEPKSFFDLVTLHIFCLG